MRLAEQVILGVLLADFLTAFFHFFEDTYLPYTSKPGVLGEIARDNELHHALPYSMVSPPVITSIQVTLPISLSIVAILYIAMPAWSTKNWIFLVTMFLTGTISNVFHRWQHERECTRPRVVTALQNAGIIVSRDQHHRHHDHPEGTYGVILGFTNQIYDGLGVWDLFRTILPFKQYPLPALETYTTSNIIPPHILRELQRPCPEKLSREDVDIVRENLKRSYVST